MLEKINGPEDLKKLPLSDLPGLATEIRQLIIQTVNNNGGHLASNLGVVELTIALHSLFDSPRDTILFDVSHQCYTHKILTGRARNFASIRTSQGYSGYCDIGESPHDAFTLGHAGCTPSLALGMATAHKLRGDAGYVVAVIGDGSLTSGLAYEGLSNIIQTKPENLMVVLNDNGMAISPNVGWLANWRDRWLPKVRAQLEVDQDFRTLKESTEHLAPKIPFGGILLEVGRGFKSAIDKSLIPEIGLVWEEMGFEYIGPVDGHNITELNSVLSRARQFTGKVPFVHVLTNKGQGWAPSTHDPVRYHQPGPPTQGKRKGTYSQIFAACLGDLMEKDKRIVAISAAMLEGTSLSSLQAQFPNRIIDVGICEEHAVSMAAGMAKSGLRPVVCIYSTFLQRAFDQIMDIAMNDLPVVFALDRAGFVGQDGKTHHGLYDLAYMRIIPNMIVAVPRDENQMCHLLNTALHQDHPFSIRYPRGEAPGEQPDAELQIIDIGKSEVIHDCLNAPKTDPACCLAAVGAQVNYALQAAAILEEQGIAVKVVDVRFVKPVDPQMIEDMVHNFTDIVVIEEGTSVGGVAAALLEALSQTGAVIPWVHQLSVGDTFPDHGEVKELRHLYGLDAEAIAAKVRNILNGGK